MRHFEASRLQFPNPLASPATVSHEARIRERVKVLGDRLTCDFGPFTQARDREWSVEAEPRNDTEAPRIPQGSEHGRGFGQLPLPGVTGARHGGRSTPTL